ncbi:MAG TPA: FliI/YscN family ATPase [Vicinamibacterales bacterium]|nr:FliI/YscN family ATPase [Vicinamibacterales bacterium]
MRRVTGMTLEAEGCEAPIGSRCVVVDPDGGTAETEVVGFSDGTLLLVATDEIGNLTPGARVIPGGKVFEARAGQALLGRVIDGAGEPLDGLGPLRCEDRISLTPRPMNPLDRKPIREPLDVGVRSINALLTVGRGQRLGLFAGSGVGKSVLLGMMTRFTTADVIVVGLIGERGREVQDFVSQYLTRETRKRAVIIATPADRPPLVRVHSALLATSIAEYFRDQGKNVLLLMDSVTRFAMSQREVGLAAGEPPTTKGYTPSVFALLPALLERAGAVRGRGSITGMYTVLVDGDDHNEPVADAVRSILDGHVVLSRDLASRHHYPPIDVLQSVSRTMPDVTDVTHRRKAGQVREWMAAIRDSEDLVSVGAYVAGSNPRIDEARAKRELIGAFLCQDAGSLCSFTDAVGALEAL